MHRKPQRNHLKRKEEKMEAKLTRIECKEVCMEPDANCEDTCGCDARIHRLCTHRLTLGDTAEAMSSPDYKERFIAEYVQTKIRYEKLKAFNTKIEAAHQVACNPLCVGPTEPRKGVEMPKHDCPEGLLREQQSVMGQYLHILETRAVIEGIDLSNY
jgi:hypothetical protein